MITKIATGKSKSSRDAWNKQKLKKQCLKTEWDTNL
jgi:hypothetical protein